MAMASSSFDAQAALAEARSGATPEGWAKFSVVRGLILTRVITVFVGAALSLVFGAFIVWAESPLTIFEVIGGALFGLTALGLLALGAQGLQTLRRLSDYFFLITPQGFAQQRGAKVVALPLAEIAKVKLVRDLFNVSLLITKRSGDILKVSGLRDYGQPMQIAQRLIDACSAMYPNAKAEAK